MRELSNYPPGTSGSDPNAPWNQSDGPEHDEKTITGRQANGQEESITFCKRCHRTEFCNDWEDSCPVEPEDDGPDVDALYDQMRDERAEQEADRPEG